MGNPTLENMPDDFFLSNVLISMFVVKRKETNFWLPISFKPRQGGINSINLKRIVTRGYEAIADLHNIEQ